MDRELNYVDTGVARGRLAMCLAETDAHLVLVSRSDVAAILNWFDFRDEVRHRQAARCASTVAHFRNMLR